VIPVFIVLIYIRSLVQASESIEIDFVFHWQIKKHCGNPLDVAGSSSTQDKGHVQQCLIDHVASKDITEEKNNKCFKVGV
jgi:hypothetical protein